jgi:hypothetical protein
VFWVRTAGPNRFLSFTRRVGVAWTPAADAFQFAGVLNVSSVAAAAQPDGSIRVFYTALAGTNRVLSRRFTGVWGAEELVDATDQNSQVSCAVDPAGTIIAAWRRESPGPVMTAQTIRYPLGGPAGAVTPAGVMVRPGDHAITVDPAGAPQIVYVQTPQPLAPNWSIFQKRFVAGAWEVAFTDTTLTIPVDTFIDLATGYAADGALWVFYATAGPPGFSVLRAKRVVPGTVEVRELLPPGQTARFPTRIADAVGNASLYFQNGALLQQIGLVQQL